MSEAERLAAECRVFTRFLVGAPASVYVVEHYRAAHAVSRAYVPTDRFEAWLVRLARGGPLWTKLTDSYARVFAPRSALRKKLVLVLAILETCPPFYRAWEPGGAVGRSALLVALVLRGLGFLVALVLGTLICSPLLIGRPWRRGGR